jgi:hypothetical protein
MDMTPQLPAGSIVDAPEVPPALLLPRTPECRICLGAHDDEIHAATLSVRRWFRNEVTKGFGITGLIAESPV